MLNSVKYFTEDIFDNSSVREYTSSVMSRNHESGDGLTVEQVALKNASTIRKVLDLAWQEQKVAFSPRADADSDEEAIRTYMPGATRQEDYGRTVVRDCAVGLERAGQHISYILDACGGIAENEGVIRVQNVLPAAGGSSAWKFTMEDGVVTAAQPFLESRF